MAQGIRIDIEKLKGALSGQGVVVAKALGIHQFSLYRKLKKSDPRLSINDLNNICNILDRDAQEFIEFFPLNGRKKESQRGTES